MEKSAWRDRSIVHMPSALSHQPWPQYVRQDAAMSESDQFFRRVDARNGLELDHVRVSALRVDCDDAAGPQPLRDAGEVVALVAGEPGRRRRYTALELQR